MQSENTSCMALIGSVTEAMRVQDILARVAIPTTVIKNEGGGFGRGCIYGVSFSCLQLGNVKSVLEHERARVKRWIEK